jgi:hypothetical protein
MRSITMRIAFLMAPEGVEQVERACCEEESPVFRVPAPSAGRVYRNAAAGGPPAPAPLPSPRHRSRVAGHHDIRYPALPAVRQLVGMRTVSMM